MIQNSWSIQVAVFHQNPGEVSLKVLIFFITATEFHSIGFQLISVVRSCSPASDLYRGHLPLFHRILILGSFPIIGALSYYMDPLLSKGSFPIIGILPYYTGLYLFLESFAIIWILAEMSQTESWILFSPAGNERVCGLSESLWVPSKVSGCFQNIHQWDL